MQALVKWAAEAPASTPSSALEGALLRENKWQAIRYGLEAAVVGADAAPTPIRSQILRTLDELSDVASELESQTALLGVEQIVRAGTGAERQLAVFAATADTRAVTRSIAAETRGAAALLQRARRRGRKSVKSLMPLRARGRNIGYALSPDRK